MKENVEGLGKLLAFYEAGVEPRGRGIRLAEVPGLETYRRENECLLQMNPSGRYYQEDIWPVHLVEESVGLCPGLVLEVDFLDEGLGVIVAQRLANGAFNGAYVPAARSVSFTRLDSKRNRRAAFLFPEAPVNRGSGEKPDFRITGVQQVRSMRILSEVPEAYWAALAEEIPGDVQPVVSLERPMQIVCSADGALSGSTNRLTGLIAHLRESLPLVKALGFNAVESYVRWNFAEPERGRFDWSLYDSIVEELQHYGLKWFPLLIVGSGYSLPDWFHASEENVGFQCLEHGLSNPVQSIWSPFHQKHVTRFLQAFGAHYGPQGILQGVRLGPSGNYGESQYPAGGNWGFHGEEMHIHIGMWAGDRYAREDFRRFLKQKYGLIEHLNRAWHSAFESFKAIQPQLPAQCRSKRQRMDLCTWYTDSMSLWCEWWAREARKALPDTPIYQSAGGWGALEIGTDYTAQAKSMLSIGGERGGIRLTNELDSFQQCFYATRLAATAARLYELPLGFEPAMGHTARGVAGRLFNCISNNGEHFFTYYGNVCHQQTAIENWLRHYPLFSYRNRPLVDVALYYPQTMNFLSSDTFRYLNAWGFNTYAREIRNHIEMDYLDDRLIQEGFLERYKVLVFVWGEFVEQATLDCIDAWMRAGGTVIFPYFLNMRLRNVEDETTSFDRWQNGDTGPGRFIRFRGDDEPPSLYADFVRSTLLELPSLSAPVRIALEAERPAKVFISAQEDGHLLVLNFSDQAAEVSHPRIGAIQIPPYAIGRAAILGALDQAEG